MSSSRQSLALAPLLATFRTLPRTDEPARKALQSARAEWLNEAFLDTAPPDQLADELRQFQQEIAPIAWHEAAMTRCVGRVRHGLAHLLRGQGPLASRFARCTIVGGAYHVPGVGPGFWAAVAKALDPVRHPLFGKLVVQGLMRVGLVNSDADWAMVSRAYDSILSVHRDLTAFDLDTFFELVAGMSGRELGTPRESLPDRLAHQLRELRTACPLKRRTADHAATLEATRSDLSAQALWSLAHDEPLRSVVENLPALAASLDSVRTPDELPDLAPMWLVASLLHVRQPSRFPLWSDSMGRGLATLDDAFDPALPPVEQYRLLCDVADVLKQRFRVHPSEVRPLLEAVGGWSDNSPDAEGFAGFCAETFRFLRDLADHNSTEWMDAERERYRFAVREPLVELCKELAKRYVEPVLDGEYGWNLETAARPGRGLSSIAKTDFGRGGPYVPVVWVTFARRRPAPRRDDVQFVVRVDTNGVAVGWKLGRRAREAGKLFRKNVQDHGGPLFHSLQGTGAATECIFGTDFIPDAPRLRSAADLRAWATGKDLTAFRWFPHNHAALRTDGFVGEALILFDRLVPLFAAAVEDDPRRILAKRAGTPESSFDRDAFRDATGFGNVWLTRTLDLLKLKKQLILQGVPGTGKTHVARCLARHLTRDRGECVRLVQFHPGYSYEEFVEGIRPKSVEMNGRSEVTYPVEPGLLASFAARAALHPADPHVLVIDEINRGNLSRVFGELLFLLEYREQEVSLPYSKAPFRLPNNLYLIGTMNPTDRSAAGLDQAMRRRFSFVDMPPDAAVLARWFDSHPPAEDDHFAPRLLKWFEDANRRLLRDLGPDRQIGHSFFMIPDLTLDGLRSVWDHQVKPLLDELFPGRPDRVKVFDPLRAFERRPRLASNNT